MRMERFYTLLGMFVGGAVILSFFTALFFYDIYVREQQDSYVMFFKGSLEGLNATSTITYNGVKIGEVKLIEITENKAGDDIRIPVYVQFFIDHSFSRPQKPIQLLMNKGFVANIKKPNFITGVASIEIIKEDTPREVKPVRYHGYLIFPTKNKPEELVSIEDTFKIAQKTLQDISTLVNSPRIRETIDATKTLADSVNRLAIHLDEETPQIMTTFIKTLLTITSAANSAQNLSDYLSRNPEALLRGKS